MKEDPRKVHYMDPDKHIHPLCDPKLIVPPGQLSRRIDEVTCEFCRKELEKSVREEIDPPVVHYRPLNTPPISVCGVNTAHTNNSTPVQRKVTCKECLEYLVQEEKKKAAEEKDICGLFTPDTEEDMGHYYDVGDMHTLDVIRAKLSHEQLQGYYLGNVIKYALRCNYKGCYPDDVHKLADYAMWLMELEHD